METFTNSQIICAIEQFLEYGEQQFQKSQQGYFSGQGWAARCLRYHKERLLTPRAPDRLRRGLALSIFINVILLAVVAFIIGGR